MMKKLLGVFFLFLFGYYNSSSQHNYYISIDSVAVSVGSQNVLYFDLTKSGSSWESYIVRIETSSNNDANNTQIVDIYLRECPVNNVFSDLDSLVYLNATYPFAVTLNVFTDTTDDCPFVDSFYLMDSHHLTASQITDITALDRNSVLQVFPNPASEFVEVDIKKIPKQAQISIYDLQGKMIKTIKTLQPKIKISITDMPNGIYIVRLNIDGVVHTRRLSIIKG